MSLAIVTGASGLLGGNLAVELLRQGHTVRATRRGTTNLKHLEDHPIQWVSAGLDDPAGQWSDAHTAFPCLRDEGAIGRSGY